MAKKTHETIESSNDHHDTSGAPGFLAPDQTVLLLTWITFFILLAVLHKFAWKPILAALDQREQAIRKSIEDADRIQKELDQLDEKKNQIITQTEEKGKEIIAISKKAASEAAHAIQAKAKEETQIMTENARREINNEMEKARAELKAESVQIAVDLAEKLLEEKLDKSKDSKLVNELIKNI